MINQTIKELNEENEKLRTEIDKLLKENNKLNRARIWVLINYLIDNEIDLDKLSNI
jgi:cell division protein FtsB